MLRLRSVASRLVVRCASVGVLLFAASRVTAAEFQWAATGNGQWGAAKNWRSGGEPASGVPGRQDAIVDPLEKDPGAAGLVKSVVVKDWTFTGTARSWDIYKATSGQPGNVTLAVEGTLRQTGGTLRIRNSSREGHTLGFLASAVDLAGGKLEFGLESRSNPVPVQQLKVLRVTLSGRAKLQAHVANRGAAEIDELNFRGPSPGTVTLKHGTRLQLGRFLTGEGGELNVAGDLQAGSAVLRFVLSESAPAILVRRAGEWTFGPQQQIEVADRGAARAGSRYELIRGLDADPGVAGWAQVNPRYQGTLRYEGGSVYYDYEGAR